MFQAQDPAEEHDAQAPRMLLVPCADRLGALPVGNVISDC